MIDVRLAIPAAAAWTSLVVALPAPAIVPIVATAAGALSTGLLVGSMLLSRCRRMRRRGTAPVLAVAALALAAVSAVNVVASLETPSRAPSLLEHPATATLLGEVSAPPEWRAGHLRILVSRVETRTKVARVSMSVLITGVEAGPRPAALHDEVIVTGRLAAADPGGELAGFLDASAPPQVVRHATGINAIAADLRRSFTAIASSLPGDGGALLPGLAVGDTSSVDASLDAAMRASGLSHLTAVSGANCAVVVACVLLIGSALGLPRIARALTAAGSLVGFVVLVTPEPSVVRAAVMAIIALLLGVLGRPVHALPVVAVTLLGLLIADPWLARSYAFALSVLATTGLVVLTAPISRFLARVLPDALALALAVPLAAQLACQPLLLTLDPEIPLVGIVANLLCEPAAPVATIVGLLACLLGGFWPGGAQVVAAAAWAPAAWIAAVARFSSDLPSSRVDWGASGFAILLCLLLTLLVAAVVLTTPFRRSRRLAVACLLVVALPLASIVTGREVGRRVSFPDDWQMVQCDVGQGDANLIRSGGLTALVDTGDDEQLLETCLHLTGVDRIDLLVLTHFDSDHTGAAPVLRGRIGELLIGPTDGRADERLVDGLGSDRVTVAEPGLRRQLGGLSLDVLWPPTGARPGNEASVVLRVGPVASCALCLTALMLGDLGEREQRRLLGRTTLGPVDVVKVAHHGSRDQSAALYEAIGARVALIGVGADNTYGHPTAQTLEVLAKTGSRVLRSDRDGTVALSTRPASDGAAPRIDVWSSGARSASAASPRLGDGCEDASRPEEDHGCSSAESYARGQGARGDRSAVVGEDPPRPGRARLRSRAVPGRARRAAAARSADRRRPQPRGERPRGRPLRAR